MIDKLIKLIQVLKPNYCNYIGGVLVFAGLVGGPSYPFWFPLLNDFVRAQGGLEASKEVLYAPQIPIFLSIVCILVGMGMIVINRIYEHREKNTELDRKSTVESERNRNVVELLRPVPKPSAFEADGNSEIKITNGSITGFDSVGKATNHSVVSLDGTEVKK